MVKELERQLRLNENVLRFSLDPGADPQEGSAEKSQPTRSSRRWSDGEPEQGASDRQPDPSPELRYTPSGTAVADLRLAVNRNYTTQSGEKREEACFLTVVVWGKQAESCGEYLDKGSRSSSRAAADARLGRQGRPEAHRHGSGG
jgi:hypothetical protein